MPVETVRQSHFLYAVLYATIMHFCLLYKPAPPHASILFIFPDEDCKYRKALEQNLSKIYACRPAGSCSNHTNIGHPDLRELEVRTAPTIRIPGKLSQPSSSISLTMKCLFHTLPLSLCLPPHALHSRPACPDFCPACLPHCLPQSQAQRASSQVTLYFLTLHHSSF